MPNTPNEPVPSPSQAAREQAKQAKQRAQVSAQAKARTLAQQLAKPAYPFTPATFKKGVVTAIAANTTPPTLTLNVSGDTTVPVSGVRWLDSYAPQVGDTVLMLKQGPDVLAIGHIAEDGALGEGQGTGWTKANLAGSWAHNGNDMGDVEYRRVWDNGSWKMQWRGAAMGGGAERVISGTTMDDDFHPSIKRKVLAARDYGGAIPSLILRVEANGDIDLEGGSFSLSGISGSTGSAGDTHTHSHGNEVRSTSFVETHTHSINGDVDVNFPNWVSFNGVEYFL